MVLSSDQFDILVKIINSSVTDNRTAMALLPVSTIMYRVRGRGRGRKRGREGEGEGGKGRERVRKRGRERGRGGREGGRGSDRE